MKRTWKKSKEYQLEKEPAEAGSDRTAVLLMASYCSNAASDKMTQQKIVKRAIRTKSR